MKKNTKQFEQFRRICSDPKASPEQIAEFFYRNYWYFGKKQDDAMAILTSKAVELPIDQKAELIPLLIKNSKESPKMIFLAKKLFDSLSTSRQKLLNIEMIYWTKDDDKTQIGYNEYKWRCKNRQKCWKVENLFFRPMQIDDLKCYSEVIAMMLASGSRNLFLIG